MVVGDEDANGFSDRFFHKAIVILVPFPVEEMVAEVERRSFVRQRDFLRSLGSKAMFTNCNNGGGEGLMKVRRELFDYVDRHFYIDHPHFLATRWRLPSFCDNVNPLRLETSPIEQYAASQVETKPFTVSEWNFSGPGRYRGVGGGSRSARSASPLRNRGMSRALAFAGSV